MFKVFQRPTERHSTTIELEEHSAASTWECELMLSGDKYLHLDFGGPILPVELIDTLLGSRPVCVKVRFGNWYTYQSNDRIVVTHKAVTHVQYPSNEQTEYQLDNSAWRHTRACSWEYTDEFTYTCWLLSIAEVPLVFDTEREKRKQAKLAEYRQLREIDKIVDEIEKESQLEPEPPEGEDDMQRIAEMTEEELNNLGMYT